MPSRSAQVRHVTSHSAQVRHVTSHSAQVRHVTSHSAQVRHLTSHSALVRHVTSHTAQVRHVTSFCGVSFWTGSATPHEKHTRGLYVYFLETIYEQGCIKSFSVYLLVEFSSKFTLETL